jgi:hypothetical protein
MMDKSKKLMTKKYKSYLEGEIVLDRYTCSLQTKLLLSGKLTVTTKRVCFRSLFNSKTLFGKPTIILLNLDDITWIEKRCFADMKMFPNSLLIRVAGSAPGFNG